MPLLCPSRDKVPTFTGDPRITVATGPGGTALRVPVVTAPALVADMIRLDDSAGEPGPDA